MLLLKCPKCGHEMRCSPRGSVSEKKKRCVYCGRTFGIEGNIVGEIAGNKKKDVHHLDEL